MFNELNWTTLDNRSNVNLILLVYKCLMGDASKYLKTKIYMGDAPGYLKPKSTYVMAI